MDRLAVQSGSTTAMLLGSWVLLLGFLGLCFDMTLYYVYRQQVQTAVEAGVTAGAMQARYRMKVRLSGLLGQYTCADQSPPSNPGPCQSLRWEVIDPAFATVVGPAWESEVWSPYVSGTPLYRLFPGTCGDPAMSPVQGGRFFYCMNAAPAECELWDYHGALGALDRAFNANRARWAGRVKLTRDERETPETSGRPRPNLRDYQVAMDVKAEMSTLFLKFFGIDRLDLVAASSARYRRLAAAPPGCERQ